MYTECAMQPCALAIALARQAGAHQLRCAGAAHQVEMKGLTNPVTEVDQACEAMILDGIRRHFPGHGILAEESGGTRRDDEWLWIVDPLDGTVNYLHGYPLYCVCIALRRGGVTELGVIYEPNHDELFVAERGKGATCNGRPMRVSPTSDLIHSVLATGFAYDRVRGELARNIPVFTGLLTRTQAVRRDGVAGVDLAYVACGRFDGFWEYYLKPWDVAAGALLVEEAGGRVTMMNGDSFDPFGVEIMASNGVVHEVLRQAVEELLP